MYKSIGCKNYMRSNIAIKNKPTFVSQMQGEACFSNIN